MQKSKKAEWDSMGSHFKQKIYLVNQKVLTGYSNHHHFRNKSSERIKSLCGMIKRMFTSGYLNPMDKRKSAIHKIEYLENQSGKSLFELYYDEYKILDSRVCVSSEEFGSLYYFLENVYSLIQAEFPIDLIFFFSHEDLSSKYCFHIHRNGNRFKNRDHLIKYCDFLVRNDHFQRPEVEEFYMEFNAKYFEGRPSSTIY